MAEPTTLLQQARQLAAEYRTTWAGSDVVECILKYLEQLHANASGPAQEVPYARVAGSLQRYTSAPLEALASQLHEQLQAASAAVISTQIKPDVLPGEPASKPAADDALDLAALQKLCDAATSGPWGHDCGTVYVVVEYYRAMVLETSSYENAAFVAAARDALPKLIARVRELQACFARLPQTLDAWGVDDVTKRSIVRELNGAGR